MKAAGKGNEPQYVNQLAVEAGGAMPDAKMIAAAEHCPLSWFTLLMADSDGGFWKMAQPLPTDRPPQLSVK